MKILTIIAAAALAISAAGAVNADPPKSHSAQREWKDLDRGGPPGPDIAQRDKDRAAGVAGREYARTHAAHDRRVGLAGRQYARTHGRPVHGKYAGWHKHRRCHTEWRHHHRVRICR